MIFKDSWSLGSTMGQHAGLTDHLALRNMIDNGPDLKEGLSVQ